jgi:cyclophilin family peptidyl-prolyl cis-trans isomerase
MLNGTVERIGRSRLMLVPLVVATLALGAATAPASAQPSGCWASEPNMEQGFPQWSEAPQQVIDASKSYTATFVTSAGNMVFELDPAAAPTTVNSFVCLASSGYYDFTLFHRIIVDFMIQGGDPTGTGGAGPGYQFNDELPEGETPYTRGTLAMANAGPNTNGSQFFIVHADQGDGFPSSYSVFGHLIEGEDVLDALATTPVTTDQRGEPSLPIRTTGILDITIQQDGEPFEP